MSNIEIPLLRGAAVYASRLVGASRRFAETSYHFHRRVNWTYRFGEAFYAGEATAFEADPDGYLRGEAEAPADLADVYQQALTPKQTAVALMKVGAHWLFNLAGRVADKGIKADGIRTWRKGYVDDIELVFDPQEAGVVRAIHPFPISVRRQLRYLAFLRRKGFRFKLAGNPYVPRDVLRLIRQRNVRALMRLESRAQLRHAREVVALGVERVQVSDEFDIGSLDFARALGRTPVSIVNSAHGVGTYLPVHAYRAFETLTVRQQQYYHPVGACRYTLRKLNDRNPLAGPVQPPRPGHVDLVFLSQTFEGPSDIIGRSEAKVTAELATALANVAGVSLLYKHHPNCPTPQPPAGFRLLADLAEVNGHPETIFVSFFSTCQIDPAFKGRKVLLREHLIHPEIVFDESEPIVDVEGLIALVVEQVRGGSPT